MQPVNTPTNPPREQVPCRAVAPVLSSSRPRRAGFAYFSGALNRNSCQRELDRRFKRLYSLNVSTHWHDWLGTIYPVKSEAFCGSGVHLLALRGGRFVLVGRSALAASMPFSPGIDTSMMIIFDFSSSAMRIALFPLSASPQSSHSENGRRIVCMLAVQHRRWSQSIRLMTAFSPIDGVECQLQAI